MKQELLLDVKNLAFSFHTYAGEVQAVRGIDFHLKHGETLGLVGESGCGKSVTAKSLIKLNPVNANGEQKSGEIIFDGRDISKFSNKKMQILRARDIRMIFQDPMTCLNPTMKVGKQIREGIMKYGGIKKAEAKQRTVEMLSLVGIPSPEERVRQYPHEFSGGMRQRAMIALAMSVNPKLLIADEPTTALDVTTQSQILKLMKKIQGEFDTAIIMITHDLGVVANIATRIAVMYGGKIVEMGPAEDIFDRPGHPYTWGLLQAVPHLESDVKQELKPILGSPPDLFNPPEGCPFAARCNNTMKVCRMYYPPKTQLAENHYTHCWLYHEHADAVINPITGGGVK